MSQDQSFWRAALFMTIMFAHPCLALFEVRRVISRQHSSGSLSSFSWQLPPICASAAELTTRLHPAHSRRHLAAMATPQAVSLLLVLLQAVVPVLARAWGQTQVLAQVLAQEGGVPQR
jgi:hypothetical protein